jgi:hypothetical protein
VSKKYDVLPARVSFCKKEEIPTGIFQSLKSCFYSVIACAVGNLPEIKNLLNHGYPAK